MTQVFLQKVQQPVMFNTTIDNLKCMLLIADGDSVEVSQREVKNDWK